jgi:hypothetical protein
MSVPTPRGLPQAAIRADSPPEEPPDVRFRLRGFVVLFIQVSACDPCGGAYNDYQPLPPITIVDRLGDHHGSGHISLHIRHSAELA